MQLEATIASEMDPDDGYGDEDEAPHQEHIVAPAAQPLRRQLQLGLALRPCRIASHSSDVYRDTPGLIPRASNSRDTALDRIWAALGRCDLSPFIAILSSIFVQRRMVHNSSSFSSWTLQIDDMLGRKSSPKPSSRLLARWKWHQGSF